MTPPDPFLDARLAALRESLADARPPASVDRAVATALHKAARRAARDPRSTDAWIAWPVALAASIAAIAFVLRAMPPRPVAGSDAESTQSAAPASASFMPLVPVAELERAGDALVVPARLSRMSLAQFGLPVNPARAADAIDAELLVRADGAVLALRFVQ